METNGSLGMAGDHNFPDPVRDEPNFPVLVRDKEIAHCFLCVQLDCRRRIPHTILFSPGKKGFARSLPYT